MIVGLTGTKASGKGIIVHLLQERGFRTISLSDIVRKEALSQGVCNYNVFQLQEIATQLRLKYGNNILASRAVELIENNPKEDYVVDGIRNTGEITELRKLKEFLLVSIDGPQKARYERLIKRARPSDPKDWISFLKMDERDRGVGEIGSKQQVYGCMEMADVKIYLEDMHGLRDKLRPIVNSFLSKNKGCN
jgi:dephospho-CoA kinase